MSDDTIEGLRARIEELTAERDRYYQMVDDSPEAIIVLDRQGKVVLFNKKAEEAAAYDRGELIGKNIFETGLIDESFAGKAVEAFGKLVEGHEVYNQEIHFTNRHGVKNATEMRGMPIGDHILVSIRNITTRLEAEQARDRAEAQLRELKQQAEKGWREAEAELEKQRTLAINADRLRSLGEMAAAIAHELNQPLWVIRGLAEHILLGAKRNWEFSEERIREKVGMIVEQADRMTHIIEHVRTFAREAGKPETRLVDVNDVVSSAVALTRTQLRTHGVNLICEFADNLPQVLANPFSLEEVLLNLITNARDASSNKIAQPEIRLRTGQDSGGVTIEVIDKGCGVEPEILDKIFEPFFTTKGPDKGTGLGLSICRSILDGFGGRIEVRSQPGTGTNATVYLPAARQETP